MSKAWKIIILVFLILLLLLITGAGVLFSYEGKELPLFNRIVTVPLVEEQPAQVVRTMQSTMADLPTARYKVTVDTNSVSEEDPWAIQSDVNFIGGLRDSENSTVVVQNEIQVGGLNFLASFEIRTISGIRYFRVSEIPAIPFIDLQNVYDVWYESAPEENFKSEQHDVLWVLSETLNSTSFFSIIERLPDETVDGVRMYHMTVQFRPAGLEAVWAEIKKIPFIGKQKQIFPLYGTEFGSIDLLIGKADSVLYSMLGTVDTESMSISYKLTVDQLNEVVSVDVPSTTVPLPTFTKDFFGGTNILDIPLFGYLVGIDTEELIEDTDNDSLYKVWEDLFDTDSTKQDTDEDGFTDGEEVRNGYNPVGEGTLF